MDCIFCKIAKKEAQSEIVYEDENFIAFLDIHPRSKGMTLVIPKKHVKSLEEDENLSSQLFLAVIKIAKAIQKALSPIALSIAYLPSQIDHLHIRIYPYFENEIPIIENKPIEVSQEELRNIANRIKDNVSIDILKKEEEKVEIKNEGNSEEEKESYWAKRDWLIA